MPLFENGPVKIHYEETGDGFPLLCLPGGGLNGTLNYFTSGAPFDPLEEFSTNFRCIGIDRRNAEGGQSVGPLDINRNWDSYTDDHLDLMDHLGHDKFMVLGFCIGGPLIWHLLERAPNRVAAAVLAQPSGIDPDAPETLYQYNSQRWPAALSERRPDITLEMAEEFLRKMYLNRGDFVLTVDRDFVRQCQTPVLILPDDVPVHPFAIAMESAELAPNAQVSLFPWKEPESRIPMAVRHVRDFLKANCPAMDL
jgi:pimeloyl-ACP methyl ester carboxylesterase